jgi:1,4-dihydroxy-2-naphthoyl-CoA hydrolase
MSDTGKYKLAQEGHLPAELGFEPLEVRRGYVKARLKIEKRLLAPHGFLHAASVVLLADTCAGYGCLASLPEGAQSFTTIELKTNFLGTAREGTIECEARGVHLGKSTQVWDAEVTHNGKAIALFRCTQMILK